MALAAGTVGAGALDAVPHMFGSDTLKNLTQQVLNGCTALLDKGNPIVYDGTGSGSGENALKVTGAAALQLIAPMSRAMTNTVCSGPTVAQRAGAEGMVIALDGLAIVGNAANVGPEGIDYPGTAANPANEWRTVLRLIYTGMPVAAGTNLFLRDCDSDARKAIVNNWDSVFHGTVTSCTDSHPSVPGSGANGYDAANSIIEPGVRHAFRRDDESGTTDVFLGQLGMSGIDFAAAAPGGANAVQTAVYRALARSPFCNNKRPEDKWQPTTLPANPTLGYFASQIPEMTNV
ncbi:MAG TPA: substrate-binding domain-containing protein, partial [Polyangiaceae bacterium]